MDLRDERWRIIAEQYRAERANQSFNSLLLDDLVCSLLGTRALENETLLDFGAGNGELSLLSSSFGMKVTAFEPNVVMRNELTRRLPPSSNIDVLADLQTLTSKKSFNVVLCLNVLDHIGDIGETLRLIKSLCEPKALVIISVPHPLKDLGEWRKTQTGDTWEYQHYELLDYLAEGICRKNREDSLGNVIASDLPSFHRTVSTYFNSICSAGLLISRMYEPVPKREAAAFAPILFSKCSRIPYFLVFVCMNPAGLC